MKFLPAQVIFLMQDGKARRNIRALAEFSLFLIFLVVVYSYLKSWDLAGAVVGYVQHFHCGRGWRLGGGIGLAVRPFPAAR
jgi:hypothetical protein